MLKRPLRFLALLGALLAGLSQAGQVRVAVAANFAAPMQKIAATFARDTGHSAVLAVGSTGKFYAQIIHGAPFHVLLAADSETPARLEKEGLAVSGSRFTYAVGRLVLWSRNRTLVDGAGDVLRTAHFDRMAVADPKLAPYGAAARDTLQAMGLLSALQPRLVQGESIGQVYQFVASGNAALGFVALSQVMLDGKLTDGSAWIVPAPLYAPLRQDAVVLNAGQGNAAAMALVSYLQSDPVRAVMRGYGYDFPR
jgi:molybdate transport system substrate-binding protein